MTLLRYVSEDGVALVAPFVDEHDAEIGIVAGIDSKIAKDINNERPVCHLAGRFFLFFLRFES